MTWIDNPIRRDWYKSIGSGDLSAVPTINNSSGASHYGLWAGLQFYGSASVDSIIAIGSGSSAFGSGHGPSTFSITAGASTDWDCAAGQAVIVILAYQKVGICSSADGVSTYSSSTFELIGNHYVSGGTNEWSASIQAYVSTNSSFASNHVQFTRDAGTTGTFFAWMANAVAYKVNCTTASIDRGGINDDGFNTFYNCDQLTETSQLLSSDRSPAPVSGQLVINSFMFNRHTTSETLSGPSTGGWTAASGEITHTDPSSVPCPPAVAVAAGYAFASVIG